jgi:hypothetical protein
MSVAYISTLKGVTLVLLEVQGILLLDAIGQFNGNHTHTHTHTHIYIYILMIQFLFITELNFISLFDV